MKGDFSLMSMIDTGNKSVRRVGTRKDPNWKSFIMLSEKRVFLERSWCLSRINSILPYGAER